MGYELKSDGKTRTEPVTWGDGGWTSPCKPIEETRTRPMLPRFTLNGFTYPAPASPSMSGMTFADASAPPQHSSPTWGSNQTFMQRFADKYTPQPRSPTWRSATSMKTFAGASAPPKPSRSPTWRSATSVMPTAPPKPGTPTSNSAFDDVIAQFEKVCKDPKNAVEAFYDVIHLGNGDAEALLKMIQDGNARDFVPKKYQS